MKEPLWIPSADRVRASNIAQFIEYVNRSHRIGIRTYGDLYDWSIRELADFWAAAWDFLGVRASSSYEAVIEDIREFPGARWFPGARLNFAENLLRHRGPQPALIFRGENGASKRISYSELHQLVGRLAAAFRRDGVGAGDRVVGYLPNLIETVVAMLATTSIGATWASCATDVGPEAALDRLGQIRPKVMITADGYSYKGQELQTLRNAAKLASAIKTLERVVLVPYLGEMSGAESVPHAVAWMDYLADTGGGALEFEQLPFDHPVFVMFSSGTTGKPKCLVQGAGGVLLNHLKELVLHTDLKAGDRILYITSCSWMMWNWLMSSLAVGATIVLYEGNPIYPNAGAMWDLIDQERVNVFGCSASYLTHLAKERYSPKEHHALDSLREISQTGSALSIQGFEYVYREIKADLHFNSISGGTDINGCFAAGSPLLPVYAGQVQSPALGMKIKAYDESGRPIRDGQGELVCESPAPSMPLYFWDDADGEKYRLAYFEKFPGVWRHGDFISLDSETGGVTFYGRSDAVLKPSGVRIGTAEIYSQLEHLPEITDCLAVGQDWENDQRVLLFIKLADGAKLDEELQAKIRRRLREHASPRHVPALILSAPDIPYTMNMKKVESAVANILNGRPVTNHDALKNPGSLEYFRRVAQQLRH